MATAIGSIVVALAAAVKAKLGTAYDVRHGLPDLSGLGMENTESIYVRCQQEVSEVQSNRSEIVKPRVSVYVVRPFTGDPTAEATHLATLDLLADVRLAIVDRCFTHSTGAAPISGYTGPLYYERQTSTPAILEIAGGGTETVTVDFELKYQRNVGDR